MRKDRQRFMNLGNTSLLISVTLASAFNSKKVSGGMD